MQLAKQPPASMSNKPDSTDKVGDDAIAALKPFDAEARFKDLLALSASLPPLRCAVVHPCDADSLSGAIAAAAHGLILPVLIGPEARLRRLAAEAGIDLNGIDCFLDRVEVGTRMSAIPARADP